MPSTVTAVPRVAPAVSTVARPLAAPARPGLPPRDAELTGRLMVGDEDAFRELVAGWGPGLMRLAGCYLSSRASAEEAVQETWIAVLSGLTGFEGRSSLRTWVSRVLINMAKARARQEGRAVPVSELYGDRFGTAAPRGGGRPADDTAARCWTSMAAPAPWYDAPEPAALAAETRRALCDALLRLPERQRIVVTLRDIYGYTSKEICELLDLSPVNQRVLLHRARAALRIGLDWYYAERGGKS